MADDLFPDLFDDFWDAYPRKVGKKAAGKAFAKFDEQQQKAAIADVEKRNRMRAWSNNKKLIPHAATYLNQERFYDEWQDEVGTDEDKPNTGEYRPRPPAEETDARYDREFSMAEVRLNSAFRDYLFVGGSLPDVGPALKIKNEVLNGLAVALREDIESGAITKERAAFEIVDDFLTKMDHDYNRNLKDRVWRRMRSNAA